MIPFWNILEMDNLQNKALPRENFTQITGKMGSGCQLRRHQGDMNWHIV